MIASLCDILWGCSGQEMYVRIALFAFLSYVISVWLLHGVSDLLICT